MTNRSLHIVFSADGKQIASAVGASVTEIEKLNKAADKMSEKLGKADGGARAMAVLEAAVHKLGGTSVLTADQISMVKDRIEQLSSKGAAIPAQFAKLKAEMDSAAASGRALGASHDALASKAQGLASSMGPLGGVLTAIGPAGLAAAAGIGAVVAAGGALGSMLEAAVSKAVAFGAKFQDMSDNTKVSANTLQLIAGSAGIGADGLETFASGIRKLNKELLSTDAGPKFAQLGLSVQELLAMKPEDRFQAVAMAIKGLGSDAEQSAASQELLGKSFPLKTLEDFANLEEKMGRSKRLGLGLDDNATAQLKALSDEAGVLATAWEQLLVNLGATIATTPGVKEGLTGITEAVGVMNREIADNKDGIQSVVGRVESGMIKLRGVILSLQPVFAAIATEAMGRFGPLLMIIDKLSGPQVKLEDKAATAKMAADFGIGPQLGGGFPTPLPFRPGAAPVVPSIFPVGSTETGGIGIPKPKWSPKELADQEDLLKRAKAAAEAYAKKVEELGEKLSGVSQNGKSLKEIEDALRKIGGAGGVARDQLEGIGKSLLVAVQSGQKLGPNADALLQRYLQFVSAAEDAAAATAFMNTELAEQERVMRILGPTAQDIAVSLSDLMKAATGEGGSVDLGAMSGSRLVEYTKRLEALAAQAAATGKTVKGLDVTLGAAMTEAGNRGGAVAEAVGFASSGGSNAYLRAWEANNRKQEEATQKTIEWQQAMGGVASILDRIAGSLGGGIRGEIASLAAGAAGAVAGLGNYNAQIAANKAKGINGLTTGQKIQGGAAAAGTAFDIYNSNKNNLSAAGGAMSGMSSGAAAGSAFGPYGAVIGAVAGGLIGLFSGSKFRDMAKTAGKVLGVEMTKELAQAIDATKKKLGVGTKEASLLNISNAMDGKDPRQFGKQVQQLLEGIADKSIPAKEGLEELAKDFGSISDAALKAGSVGDKAMVGIIKRSRELGVESPEIKDFVKGQLGSAAGGVGGMVSGLKLGTQADAEAQGTIFATTFWASVKENGITGAADAFKDSFAKLGENLAAGGFDISGILGPISSLMGLAGNEMFRGAADGASGLKAALEGVANAGYLTTDSFSAFEQQAQAAFNQAVAGGASSAQAFQTIAPLLQSLVSASGNYGINLDDATQSMIEQAKAAGIAFKTDSTDRLTASIDALTVALGGVPPKVDAIGQSLRGLPSNVLPFPGGGSQAGDAGGDGIPAFASGGYVAPRPGGTIVRVAEAGQGEYITPAGGRSNGGAPGSVSVSIGEMHLTVPPGSSPEEFADRFYAALRNGALQLPAA
jgi:hypothetical protein